MSALCKRLFWRLADPALTKIAARMAHLGLIAPPFDAARLAPLLSLDPRATLSRDAVVLNDAAPDHMRVGAYSYICGELRIVTDGRLTLGHHCFVGQGARIWAKGVVEIGNHVLISHLVDIHDHDSHPLDADLRRRHPVQIFETKEPVDYTDVAAAPVRIEDDAWVCFKASILKGVTIGRGAVIAAGAVVTRDVPPYALVAGNPARLIRMLK